MCLHPLAHQLKKQNDAFDQRYVNKEHHHHHHLDLFDTDRDKYHLVFTNIFNRDSSHTIGHSDPELHDYFDADNIIYFFDRSSSPIDNTDPSPSTFNEFNYDASNRVPVFIYTYNFNNLHSFLIFSAAPIFFDKQHYYGTSSVYNKHYASGASTSPSAFNKYYDLVTSTSSTTISTFNKQHDLGTSSTTSSAFNKYYALGTSTSSSAYSAFNKHCTSSTPTINKHYASGASTTSSASNNYDRTSDFTSASTLINNPVDNNCCVPPNIHDNSIPSTPINDYLFSTSSTTATSVFNSHSYNISPYCLTKSASSSPTTSPNNVSTYSYSDSVIGLFHRDDYLDPSKSTNCATIDERDSLHLHVESYLPSGISKPSAGVSPKPNIHSFIGLSSESIHSHRISNPISRNVFSANERWKFDPALRDSATEFGSHNTDSFYVDYIFHISFPIIYCMHTWVVTSPSAYLHIQSLSAERPCGTSTTAVGTTITDMRIPLNPSDVSTITWDSHLVNMSSTVPNGNVEGYWEVFWTTTTRALTWADLAGCGGGGTTYRLPASPTVAFSYPDEQEAATARPFRVNPCEPLLAIPTSLTNLQPAWATCFPDAEGGDFDPPYTLTKVGGVDGPQPTKASQGASLESQVEPTTTRAPPASSSLVVDGPTPTRTVPGVAPAVRIERLGSECRLGEQVCCCFG
ncbi:hypothetical protein SLS56_007320 [Neofusicoccum ribis]|uniref:Uncharacterized protein n=1 Tax=Neofusicoccum ribis TaxID=45134 RepID=A0ABR3SN82_9PEZI